MVISIYFINERKQLLTHNYNLTKENDKLFKKYSDILNQNRILMEKREKFRNKSYELPTAVQEKSQLILQINNLTKERDELLTNNTNLLNEINQCQNKTRSMSEERGQLINEKEECKKWFTEQDQRSDNFKWIYYNFSCYYISSEWRSWSDSRRDCEQRDADLVIINNKKEQEFLQKATGASNFWIGLRKAGHVWKWIDGTTLTLSFWMDKYPISSGHNCALTSVSGWSHYLCDYNKYSWICERRILH
nr:asialoglycoprotein receptor 1-like [Misgurnus anguillicaudatus]